MGLFGPRGKCRGKEERHYSEREKRAASRDLNENQAHDHGAAGLSEAPSHRERCAARHAGGVYQIGEVQARSCRTLAASGSQHGSSPFRTVEASVQSTPLALHAN